MSVNRRRMQGSRRESLGYIFPALSLFGPWFLASFRDYATFNRFFFPPFCSNCTPVILCICLVLGQEMTSFCFSSLKMLPRFLFDSFSLSTPLYVSSLKSSELDSDSCVTDTAWNSSKRHYLIHLIVKISFLDIEKVGNLRKSLET